MGPPQHNRPVKPVGRRLGWRTCLRKGCGQVFQAACWNQRYCQDPDCLGKVRRWQAAKRQRLHRQSPENRKRQAEAQARRRQRARSAMAERSDSPDAPAAKGALSRSNEISADFCGRPGCYEPLPSQCRAPARYCGHDCRRAVRRVLDRERKWLMRKRRGRRFRKDLDTRWQPAGRPSGTDSRSAAADDNSACNRVGDYGDNDPARLSSARFEHHQSPRCVEDDRTQADPDRRSRPPPSC